MTDNTYDLSATIVKYLDRHLALSYLFGLAEMSSCPYSRTSMYKAQYQVCSGTKRYGDLMELAAEIYQGDELKKKEDDIKRRLEELKDSHAKLCNTPVVDRFIKTVATPEGKELLQKMIKEGTAANEGMEAFGFKAPQLKDLYAYARTIYEYNQMEKSVEVLKFLRWVDPVTYKGHEGRLWGQLACNISLCLSESKNVTWKDTVADLAALNDQLEITGV